MVIHQGSSARIENITSAEPVSSLSAIGSAILPKLVISPRLRARSPSSLSVYIATAKIATATQRITP